MNGNKSGVRGNRGTREKAVGGGAYDAFKQFQGKRYTGMKVGRSHKWRYDPGEWKETKVTPDRWEFKYAVTKRRAGKAPEGSGAPIGTAYRWYILADQTVTKLDANSYSTEMIGVKHKLAHKRADKTSWSASEGAQRRRLVQILRELISDLEKPQPAASPEQVVADAKDGQMRARRIVRTKARPRMHKRSQPVTRKASARAARNHHARA